jgi:hypothetical protein
MQWDLGAEGLGLLVLMSLGAGVVAQVIGWKVTRWLWAVAAVVYFLSGLFISEVWFGWATEEELQPNIDGLSFDEVLLIAPVPVLLVILVAWLTRRRRLTPASS